MRSPPLMRCRQFEFTGAAGRRHLDRRARRPAAARGARALPRRDAVLLGAVGGPKWDSTDPTHRGPSRACSGLRKGLELFANLRPVRVVLRCSTPARCGRSGSRRRPADRAGADRRHLLRRPRPARRRRARHLRLLRPRRSSGSPTWPSGGRLPAPPRRSHSVDKANILETSRLWRETVERVAQRHPGVELEHMLVDNAAMQLIARPPTSTSS